MQNEQPKTGIRAYYPLFLIGAYIFGVSVINNFQNGNMNFVGLMNQFMAGFFLVFSAFKLFDIEGFAAGYATYDVTVQRI